MTVKHPPQCPRCGRPVQPPGLMSSRWECDLHGGVLPYHRPAVLNRELLTLTIEHARVPVWIPWPLPTGWLVTGVGSAGDERSGGRAVAVALGGPAPLGGYAEMVVVAEEPGTGLAARIAGLPGPDPGADALGGPAAVHLDVNGWPTPLWDVTAVLPDPANRTVLVGEALGAWLVVITWPETAELVLHDGVGLADLRERAYDVPLGALSTRL